MCCVPRCHAPSVQLPPLTTPPELEYVCQYNREKKRRGKVRFDFCATHLQKITSNPTRCLATSRNRGKRRQMLDIPLSTTKMVSPFKPAISIVPMRLLKWTKKYGRPLNQLPSHNTSPPTNPTCTTFLLPSGKISQPVSEISSCSHGTAGLTYARHIF